MFLNKKTWAPTWDVNINSLKTIHKYNILSRNQSIQLYRFNIVLR